MSTVSVRGRARARVQPDLATVDLVVSHVSDDAGSALNRVAAKSTSVEQLLERLGIRATDRTTGRVLLAEEREWRGDHNELVGVRATIGIEARVADLEIVPALLREAVDDSGALVQSVRWSVDADNPVWADLLGEAARDARTRAEAYAGALEQKLGAIEEISEMPFDNRPVPVDPSPMPVMMSAKVADAGQPSISPGGLDVGAEVYVRFALQPLAGRTWR